MVSPSSAVDWESVATVCPSTAVDGRGAIVLAAETAVDSGAAIVVTGASTGSEAAADAGTPTIRALATRSPTRVVRGRTLGRGRVRPSVTELMFMFSPSLLWEIGGC